ncbi:MAG: GDYXXLXY domain-containing protein [Cyanobacteriota bacterium]|nr:GDYXXLXY domain-containing protein [Cyanobacteriota bacterium]
MRNAKPIWRFILPLVFQAALILGVPAQAIYTHWSGQTVILQTIPVDPYDPLRGYYQTLRYDISRVETLKPLPGWQTVLTVMPDGQERLQEGTQLYAILQEPSPNIPQPSGRSPQPWKPVGVSRDRPSDLPENRVAIRGTYNGFEIDYGLERYYMPADRRTEINDYIDRTLQQAGNARPFVVEVKVSQQGNSVAERLWVGDRPFQF